MGFGIGGMVVVGLIGESRMGQLSPRKQFIAFFPGVVILSIGMAALFQVAEHLPSGQRWYTAPAFHFFVIGAVALASALFAKGEYDAGTYPRRAILSPTKFF